MLSVHSGQFPHERDHDAVRTAVDDADRATWEQYAVRVWPTLVLADPDGYVVHAVTGEGHLGRCGSPRSR